MRTRTTIIFKMAHPLFVRKKYDPVNESKLPSATHKNHVVLFQKQFI